MKSTFLMPFERVNTSSSSFLLHIQYLVLNGILSATLNIHFKINFIANIQNLTQLVYVLRFAYEPRHFTQYTKSLNLVPLFLCSPDWLLPYHLNYSLHIASSALKKLRFSSVWKVYAVQEPAIFETILSKKMGAEKCFNFLLPAFVLLNLPQGFVKGLAGHRRESFL